MTKTRDGPIATVFRHRSVFLFACLAACASVPRPPVDTGAWTRPADGVEVTRSGVRIGAGVFELPVDEARLTAILGPPDRREPGANRILVWDGIGIFAYERRDADIVDALSIAFTCGDFAFCPKSGYAGILVVDDSAFWHAPDAHDLLQHGFLTDDLSCFKRVGRYRVSVDCLPGGLGTGTFEIAVN